MSLVLCLIFFLSGASALIFETLWFRLAGLTLGNSVWASSIVLSSFMAGLALGNLLAARHGPRVERPLVAYAGLEVAIGVTGFALVPILPGLTPLLNPLLGSFLETPWVLNPLRLLIAFSLLLIPATAMGATLPLLVKTLSLRDANFGRVLGRLYGWNTLGAVAGALGGEVFLIGAVGLLGTGLVAALLNGVAAVSALVISPRYRVPVAMEPEEEIAGEPVASAPRLSREGKRLLAAAFLSGATLLGLEVVWFRFTLLFINGTSLAFAFMLSVVLGGIALGGFIASWWLKLRPLAYKLTPLLALVSGAIAIFTYISLPDVLGSLSAGPVSVMSGIIFIFLGRSLEEEVPDKTRAAAWLTFSNTVGAVAGSLIAGFVLIPSLGVELSFFVLALVYGGIALLSLRAGFRSSPRTRGEITTLRLAGVAFVLLLALFPFGLMKNHYFPIVLGPYLGDGSHVEAVEEGLTEAAFYLRKDLFGQPRYHRLVTNGISMSTTTFRAKRYMRLFAFWPVAVHPEATRALLISYGVGVTARALADTDTLTSIDVVDISRNLIDLSQKVSVFPEDHPLQDPRVTVHIEDGRFFLQTTEQEFDIITAEPPPPKNAGIVNLYSQEYFELLHDRLAPRGIATYWLPVYQLRVDEAKAITKGFCLAFEDCSLWTGAGTEWMLVGTRGHRGGADQQDFGAQWQKPRAARRLSAIGLESPKLLGTLFLGDARFLAEWTGDTPPLTDNYPHRVYTDVPYLSSPSEPDQRESEYLRVMGESGARNRFKESELIRRLWPEETYHQTLDYFQYQTIVNQHLARGGAGIPELYFLLTRSELRSVPLMLMSTDEEDLPILEDAVRENVQDPMLDYLLAAHAMSDRDYHRAVEHLDRALARDAGSAELVRFRILALVLSGQQQKARESADVLRAREARGQAAGGDARFWAWLETVLDSQRPFESSVGR